MQAAFPILAPTDAQTVATEAGGVVEKAPLRPTKLRGMVGLRGAGVLTVMLYHCWLYSSPDHVRLSYHGWEEAIAALRSGRVMFFVLSGFLLYRSYTLAFVGGRSPEPLWTYLSGRVLRVLPGYWFAFVLVALVFGIARTDIVTLSLGNLSDRPWTVLANLFVLQTYFPGTILTGIGPTWSLGVEIAFYVTLPVVGGLMIRKVRDGMAPLDASFAGAACFVALGLFTKLGLALSAWTGLIDKSTWTDAPYTLVMLSMPFNADLFGCGMLLAAFEAGIVSGMGTARWARRVAVAAAVVATACILGFVLRMQISGIVGEILAAVLVAVGIYLLTVRPGGGSISRSVTTALESRLLTFVGLVSYGVFLWNEPVILWLREKGYTFPGWAGLIGNYALMLAATLCFAKLTSVLVEKPALKLKAAIQGRLRPVRVGTPA